MFKLSLSLLLCFSLMSCGWKRGWLIESYEDGVITANIDGRRYSAVCESHIARDSTGKKVMSQGRQACGSGTTFPASMKLTQYRNANLLFSSGDETYIFAIVPAKQ